MSGRSLTGIAGLALGVALVALLFTQLGFSLSDLGALLSQTPVWLLGVVTSLTLAVQLIGALRWRLVQRWLAPEQDVPTIQAAVAATSWGSFFGQVLPIQLAMPAARYLSSRKGSAVGSTLYEGLFDFVVLTSGALAAALVLLADLGAMAGAIAFVCALALGCAALRPSLHVLSALLEWWQAARLPACARLHAFNAPLKRIASAPGNLIAPLAGWSIVKLLILSARLLLIALVFAGPIDATLVAVGYPIVGLTLGVPFLPAGLGLADWSWTGILVLAGASASIAGLTAIVARVLNFAALFLIVALAVPLWSLVNPAPKSGVSPQSAI